MEGGKRRGEKAEGETGTEGVEMKLLPARAGRAWPRAGPCVRARLLGAVRHPGADSSPGASLGGLGGAPRSAPIVAFGSGLAPLRRQGGLCGRQVRGCSVTQPQLRRSLRHSYSGTSGRGKGRRASASARADRRSQAVRKRGREKETWLTPAHLGLNPEELLTRRKWILYHR